MAHKEQQFFINGVKQFLPSYFQNIKILEIGSLNLNGTARDFYNECDYWGIDVGAGKDVDEICFGENYGSPANHFDAVISIEAMEHNLGWQKTWINMIRVLKTNGLMIMTCATSGRKQHGTLEFQPYDSPLTTNIGKNYYRNLNAQDFLNITNLDTWFSVWGFFVDGSSYDLYFFGLGLDADQTSIENAKNLKNALTDYYHRVNILGIY